MLFANTPLRRKFVTTGEILITIIHLNFKCSISWEHAKVTRAKKSFGGTFDSFSKSSDSKDKHKFKKRVINKNEVTSSVCQCRIF